jgi:dihydroorotate dehydrogenase
MEEIPLSDVVLSNRQRLKLFQKMSGPDGEYGDGWYWLLQRIMEKLGISVPYLFDHVTKTSTYYSRKGNWKWWNPFHCIRLIPRKRHLKWWNPRRYLKGFCGTVNVVSLTNKGVHHLCEVLEKMEPGKMVIVSIYADNQKDLVDMARMLARYSAKILALEVNVSCPNTGHLIVDDAEFIINCCRAIFDILQVEEVKIPLILKISYAHIGIVEMLLEKLQGIIEVMSINGTSWNTVFGSEKSPLAHLNQITGGSVSGEAHKEFVRKLIRAIVASPYHVPVVGCGVWRYEDIGELLEMGCAVIGFGAVNMYKFSKVTDWVRRYTNEMKLGQ